MAKRLSAGIVSNVRKHVLEAHRQTRLAIQPIYHGGKTDKKIEKKLAKVAELLSEVDALILSKMDYERLASPKTKR